MEITIEVNNAVNPDLADRIDKVCNDAGLSITETYATLVCVLANALGQDMNKEEGEIMLKALFKYANEYSIYVREETSNKGMVN